MSRTLLVVTGSRALDQARCKSPLPRAWANLRLCEWLDATPDGSVILTGGCPGSPDEWAGTLAFSFRGQRKLVEYLPNGDRVECVLGSGATGIRRVSRWSEASPGPLPRNVELARAAAKAKQSGFDVRVVALGARWSRTHGTEHTVSQLYHAGIEACVEYCPYGGYHVAES